MSKWRPKGWIHPSPETHRMGSPTFSIMTEGECVAFEAGADGMVESVSQEIEKVENPYDPVVQPSYHAGFEKGRQAILAVFKEKGVNDGS